ncbi:MAG: DUF2169 domain-containing protein [Comamonadaceae bacterium]|nr:MAG: DUF2169 domain-containing protein [Comamonadaceae bacterium]
MNALPRQPRPQGVLGQPIPAVPAELAPDPSVYALVHGVQQGQWWRTLLRKVTYGISDAETLQRAAQVPIHTAYAAHDPLPDWAGVHAGRKGAMKTVPEARAFQTGTDVVLRGHAACEQPASTLLAGLVIGKHVHKVRVWGDRRSHWTAQGVTFSEPTPFTRLPLRYELAYGGFDPVALATALAHMAGTMDEVEWRRSRAFLNDVFPLTVPVAYARNPVGTGYVCEATREALDGVALPNIEFDHDLLTPERFAQGRGLDWLSRPVPAGLDFMDLRMFPRTAMAGLPPLGFTVGTRECAETRAGQIPPDFSRGNIATVDEAHVLEAIHPDAARCAPIGLRLGELKGNEPVSLVGLRADLARWDFRLPGERPLFEVPGQGALRSRLFQVFIDADARTVELLWAASWKADRELYPMEDQALLKTVRTRVEAVP